MEREEKAMRLLFEISHLFSDKEEKLNDELKKACELAIKFGGAECCSLTLNGHSGDTGIISATAHKTAEGLRSYNPNINVSLKKCQYLRRALEDKKPVTIHTEENGTLCADIHRIMQTQPPSCLILPLINANHSIGAMFLGFRKTAYSPTQKDIHCLAAVAKQIAMAYERNRLDIRLKDSEAQYREFFDNSPDIVFKTDCRGLIEDINAQFTIATGYDSAEWLGKPLKALLYDASQPGAEKLNECKVRFSGKEFQIHTDYGEKCFYFSSWPWLDRNGKAIGSWWIARDFTKQKQSEQELARTKKRSEEANRAKSLFLANISHELRTPLTAIIGFGKLISENKKVSDEIREQAGIVLKQGKSLLKLINNTLDIVETEKHPTLKLNEISPRDLIDTVLEKELEDAQSKRLEISVYINPLLPKRIVADKQKLSSVLAQLISNAIKFTSSGKVKISAWPENSMIVFRVYDTGIGIDEKHILKIFENFYQVDDSLTRRYGGAGLGLPLAKSLLIKMGGSIWVKSTPGIGCSFYFSVPLNINPPADENMEEDAYLVLAADDNESIRILVRDTILKAGFKPYMVKNGYEAVEMCLKKKFKLILLNIQMPRMTGDEAMKKIKTIPYYKDVPIIALTANTMKGDREKYLSAGFDYYIPKPFKPADLLNRMRALMRGRL